MIIITFYFIAIICFVIAYLQNHDSGQRATQANIKAARPQQNTDLKRKKDLAQIELDGIARQIQLYGNLFCQLEKQYDSETDEKKKLALLKQIIAVEQKTGNLLVKREKQYQILTGGPE